MLPVSVTFIIEYIVLYKMISEALEVAKPEFRIAEYSNYEIAECPAQIQFPGYNSYIYIYLTRYNQY